MSIIYRPTTVAVPKVSTNYAARNSTKLMVTATKLPSTSYMHRRSFRKGSTKLEFTSNESDDIFPVKAEKSQENLQKTYRLFGLLTVQEGERYAIWNADGSYSEIEGPARKFVINANFMPLVIQFHLYLQASFFTINMSLFDVIIINDNRLIITTTIIKIIITSISILLK